MRQAPEEPRPAQAAQAAAAQRRFRILVVAMLAALAVVAGVGSWAYFKVRASLRELRQAGLTALVEAEARAVASWVEEKKLDAERWASHPAVKRAAADLVRAAEGGAPCAAEPQATLAAQIAPFAAAEQVALFNVISRDGHVVSTLRPRNCGRRVSRRFLEELGTVFEGRTSFVHVWRDAERFETPNRAEPDLQMLWVETPVRADDGRVVGALGFGRLASSSLARLLRVTASGTSRDAYAFDPQGRIVSDTRHGGVEARDPATRELTPLAAAALSGEGGGVLLAPYRNYRGAEVIGAWRWLPEARMAVAVEIDAAEAYGPLEYLQIAFATLFTLVLAASAIAAGTSLWAARVGLREAKRIGPYRIERKIGEGGMSDVYEATHAFLGRKAAVKVLKQHLATDEAVERFHREAQLCSQLRHPNTVEIYDYGTTRDGRRYYAMEHLEGISLEALVAAHGPLPVARVVHVLRQACGSLREAHERGWVHRDVKPGNLMLCVRAGEHDVVKLLDFGIVKRLRDPHTRDLTQYSKVLGTPLYMAPERLRDPADADARSDIYALAAVAYFALAGRPAFEAQTDHDIIYRVMNEPAPPLAQGGVTDAPPELEALIARCLEKDRERRPGSVAEVAARLEALAAAHPWTPAQARAWWDAHGRYN